MINYYMSKIIILLLSISILSCSGSQTNNLADNSTINNIFSPGEVKDLSSILNFFENQICSSSFDSSCYEQYLKQMNEAAMNNGIKLNLSYAKQTSELYQNISPTTFQEIWDFGELSKFDIESNSRVKYKDIGLNYKGKYINFLQELSKEYPAISNYYEFFIEAGDISPAMVSIITNYQSFDLSDTRVRLVIAVHCLTMNDKYERQERI